MTEIRVARLSVTPVKGTMLHHPGAVDVKSFGVPDNRRFFFVDPHGASYNAGGLGPLMGVGAWLDGDVLTLDGHRHRTLRASVEPEGGPETDLKIDMWGRPRAVRRVPGPWDEFASDLVGTNLRLVEAMTPGDGNDTAPITLVSLASVAALAERAGVPAVDPDRFRMTIDVDGVEAHEEDSWAGCLIAIGSAVLRVGEQVPRCLVTTWDPQSGARDLNTLKFIGAYRERIPDGLPFGMYASVIVPGVIRLGDGIDVLGHPHTEIRA